jgi:hypothetical protein
MSDPKRPPEGIPDLHGGNVAQFVAHRLKVPGVIVLISNEDGSVGLNSTGVNHKRGCEMLSVGTYITLDQHYELIRQGVAGSEARDHIEALENFERKEVTQ